MSSSATGYVATSMTVGVVIGQGRRYFGTDPDRNFGVGPGSYECYGYDCNR